MNFLARANIKSLFRLCRARTAPPSTSLCEHVTHRRDEVEQVPLPPKVTIWRNQTLIFQGDVGANRPGFPCRRARRRE